MRSPGHSRHAGAASAANGLIKALTGVFCAWLTLQFWSTSAWADTMDDEISYLIGSVGRGYCVFIRNGKRYRGRDARAHLRSKRRLNSHLIDSTEEFIEKIASRSVTTGKPYLIKCRGEDEQPLGEWLTALLADYREKDS